MKTFYPDIPVKLEDEKWLLGETGLELYNSLLITCEETTIFYFLLHVIGLML